MTEIPGQPPHPTFLLEMGMIELEDLWDRRVVVVSLELACDEDNLASIGRKPSKLRRVRPGRHPESVPRSLPRLVRSSVAVAMTQADTLGPTEAAENLEARWSTPYLLVLRSKSMVNSPEEQIYHSHRPMGMFTGQDRTRGRLHPHRPPTSVATLGRARSLGRATDPGHAGRGPSAWVSAGTAPPPGVTLTCPTPPRKFHQGPLSGLPSCR